VMPNRPPNPAAMFVERHWRAIEWIVAIAVSVAAVLLLGSGEPGTRLYSVLGDDRAALYGTISGVAGSLLGFVLAAATILVTVAGLPSMGRVTSSNQYGELWSMFLTTTKWLGLLTLWALGSLVVDKPTAPFAVMPYTLLFLSMTAAFQVGTCVWALERVTRVIAKAGQL
jgi:hypothetical protein